MRICVISNLYPPHSKGGAERVASEEVRALRAMGHDVSVITASPLPDDGDPGIRMSVEDGVRIYRFYPLNFFFYGDIDRHGQVGRSAWHLWDTFNRDAAAKVAKILAREKPQAVHTHNLKGLGFLIPSVIRKAGIRHVHTLHDVQLVKPSGLIIKGEGLPTGTGLYAKLTRKMFGSPDVVISPSRFLMEFYDEHGFFPLSEKVLLPNPAPEVRLQAMSRKPVPETRFLFLGQVETHKGILDLIEAFRILLRERSDVRLDVVGEGAALSKAVNAAGRDMRIAFYGKRQPSKFATMFGEADYTVLPSLCYENAPTVVGESFAFGVPVLAADIGGAAERVKDGKNGFVFPAGDVYALVDVMKRAADEKKKGNWAALSQEARRSGESLGAHAHAARLAAIYQGNDAALRKEEAVIPIRYFPKPPRPA